eukprot:scaffold27712_cov110-Isochrysis_galbana.AAC.4
MPGHKQAIGELVAASAATCQGQSEIHTLSAKRHSRGTSPVNAYTSVRVFAEQTLGLPSE